MEQPKPLSMERTEKLKIYTVLSVKKTVPKEIVENGLALILLASYTEPEAMMAVGFGLKASGKNIDDYILGVMRVQVDLDKLVDADLLKAGMETPATPVNVVPVVVDKKTVEEQMIENVRIMFNLVGTSAQEQAVMKRVVKKFEDYVAEKKDK